MRGALAFLTPLGGARSPSPRALPWFPVVGAVVGAAVGAVWELGTAWWTPFVGAALAVVADLALTGMLHVDGLADAADGLLPHLAPERRLEVMRQPDVGAFGVAVTGGALLVETAALTAMSPDVWMMAALWAVTRGVVAVALASLPYARPGGLADAFRGRSAVAFATLGIALVALLLRDPVAIVGALLGAVAVVVLAMHRIGGYTGDVLGAAIVVAQVAGLLAAAA